MEARLVARDGRKYQGIHNAIEASGGGKDTGRSVIRLRVDACSSNTFESVLKE
jgi:hypothetical protein